MCYDLITEVRGPVTWEKRRKKNLRNHGGRVTTREGGGPCWAEADDAPMKKRCTQESGFGCGRPSEGRRDERKKENRALSKVGSGPNNGYGGAGVSCGRLRKNRIGFNIIYVKI